MITLAHEHSNKQFTVRVSGLFTVLTFKPDLR